MTTDHNRLRFDGDEISAEEGAATEKVIDIELQLLKRRIASGNPLGQESPVRRAQHPKHHGCVKAEFVVDDSVPRDFAHGLFSQSGRRYPAWIRFSNARKQDDREPGGHGMAVKLMGVAGDKLLPGHEQETTHDFLLLDSPVFFIKDALEFAEFDAALLNSEISWFGKLSVLGYFLMHPHEAAILHRIEKNQASNPLDVQYWSATPYKLGPNAVKYVVLPQSSGPRVTASAESPDRLREAMMLQLQTREARFDFCVQLQIDPNEQPIDDATRLWDTPYQRIATIRIPPQSFDGDEQMMFCENLSFNPWHALIDHRPLGSLNRLRRATYLALSDFRHQQNRAASVEPSQEPAEH